MPDFDPQRFDRLTHIEFDEDGNVALSFNEGLDAFFVRLAAGAAFQLGTALVADRTARAARGSAESARRTAIHGAPANVLSRMEALGVSDHLFDRFVALWPATAGVSPDRLRHAWDSLTPAERQDAVEALPHYLATAREQKRRTLPHAVTYLTEKRWRYLTKAEPSAPEERP